ncbi:hypothetical protein OsI_29125 [Oryza sativa Indica Group]|uniref:Uncharacterized protein n=3 Tax=Oryza TaxID=4527 RepID=A0A0E0QIK3_ORYRU|nr:hypothetical protein OsI_29125 [Oryza sativa Indica Group]
MGAEAARGGCIHTAGYGETSANMSWLQELTELLLQQHTVAVLGTECKLYRL